MASFTAALSRFDDQRLARLRRVAPEFLLFAAIGIELMVLVTWLPDTLDVWFRPDTAGYGDFPIFYKQAQGFSLNATYSPGLGVLMHPLAHFSMRVAFLIYTGVNVAALLGIAFIAQRSVESMPAKVAIALGVLALPQTHWAIRVGHFMPVLAFATLCGMMLAERRPVAAGMLIGVLALKPQYLPVPVLYFLWTHNWRAFLSSVGTLAGLAAAGVGAAVWTAGPEMVMYTVRHYTGSVGYLTHHLTAGQQDQIYVEGWQYSWYGFLVSAGIDPNPLLAADLLLLSLAGMLLAWWKCTPSVAKVATVLGMLLLTPHSTFYNWSLISVAGVLLLRSDVRPRYLAPVMIAGIALAAAATQNATPFPVPVDLFRPAATRGLYWIQPAALAALFTLALAARRHAARQTEAPSSPAVAHRRWSLAMRPLALPAMRRASVLAAAAVVGVSAGYAGGAYVSGSGPFRADPYFARRAVLRALPSDFPVPPAAKVDDAGSGTHLPYRVEWETPDQSSDVAGLMRRKLGGGTWQIVESSDDGQVVRLRSARNASSGGLPFIAEIDITRSGSGSKVKLEFSPLPSSLVPGYDRWLQSVGLVVHNVDRDTPVPQLGK
jgi:hypothetical protein